MFSRPGDVVGQVGTLPLGAGGVTEMLGLVN